MEDAEYTPGLVAQILGNKEKKKSSEKSDKRLTSLFAATKLATPLYASPPVLKNQVNKMLSVYHETLERCFLFSIAKSLSSFTVLLNTSANPPPLFFSFCFISIVYVAKWPSTYQLSISSVFLMLHVLSLSAEDDVP